MFKRLMPARAAKIQVPVADLDAIVAEPTPFRFQGEIHFIKPISVAEFLKFTNANVEFHALMKTKERVTEGDLLEGYARVIESVCDTIKVEHVRKMQQAQVAALYQLIIDVVTGQAETPESGKKKRLKIPLYDSAPPPSLPSAPADSVGQ